ncbi:MAG: hypothetical protein ACQER4_03670 [Bacteroidota bacterium]
MKTTTLARLVWLLPLYFLLMLGYQWLTYNGIHSTWEEGESYMARVLDFDVKQIAAQTSGYVVLSFDTPDGPVEERLSLSVQMAQVLTESELVPVRYRPDSFRPIVLTSTYDLQRNVIRVNLAISVIGLLATLWISWLVMRWIRRQKTDPKRPLNIRRTDQ